MTFEIGRDCEWTAIIGQVFHVLEFDRAGTIIKPDGQVKAKGFLKPYGYLLVESPILNQSARLPIIHKDDFSLAASVYDDPQWSAAIRENELLVTYVPKTKLPLGFAGTSHALHYVITPPGTLVNYYAFRDGVYMVNPAPEKIFVNLAWDGLIRVQVNSHPEL